MICSCTKSNSQECCIPSGITIIIINFFSKEEVEKSKHKDFIEEMLAEMTGQVGF